MCRADPTGKENGVKQHNTTKKQRLLRVAAVLAAVVVLNRTSKNGQ